MRSGILSKRMVIEINRNEINQVLSYLSWSRFMLTKLGGAAPAPEDLDEVDEEEASNAVETTGTQSTQKVLKNLEILLQHVRLECTVFAVTQQYNFLHSRNLVRFYPLDRNTFLLGFDTTTTEQLLNLPWGQLIALGNSLDRRLSKRLGSAVELKPQTWVTFLHTITALLPVFAPDRTVIPQLQLKDIFQIGLFSELFASESLPAELRDVFHTWFERAAPSLRVTAPWLAKYCKMEKVYSK